MGNYSVMDGQDTLYRGTLAQCWAYLLAFYGDKTVATLQSMDIKIVSQ